MFDENEYLEVFSQVKASENITRRVLNMKRERKQRRIFARAALIAAALILMAVSVAASESVQNWFVHFFAEINRDGLTTEQVEYIEKNTQMILDSQTHNGWTVELNSAIRGEKLVYIIFSIKGPDDVDLSQWTDEAGNLRGQVTFGNSDTPAYLDGLDLFFDFDENVEHGGWGYYWMDDGDGKEYTEILVFHLEPGTMHDGIDAFGEETVYHFRFQDIIWYWLDMEYMQTLNREKYPGQGSFEYTEEEQRKIHRWETLAEGIWEFEISFGQLEFVEGELPETYG
jgi:hypothetical protein